MLVTLGNREDSHSAQNIVGGSAIHLEKARAMRPSRQASRCPKFWGRGGGAGGGCGKLKGSI
jgi:formyltetrahydrofolate synthetase